MCRLAINVRRVSPTIQLDPLFDLVGRPSRAKVTAEHNDAAIKWILHSVTKVASRGDADY